MNKPDYVKFEVSGNVAIAELQTAKILDEEVINQIENQIDKQMNDLAMVSLVLDFSRVQFLTSSFLGYLIRLQKNISDNKGQLRLCGINEKIEGIFKITRLDKIFDIHEDSQRALLSMGQVG